MAIPAALCATGDLITAAQINGFPMAIAEASGAGASYDFTSIPSFWTHLSIIVAAQTGSGSNSDTLTMRFNNDSGSNYLRQRDRFSNTTTDVTAAASSTSLDVGEVPGITGGSFGSYVIWIPNYSVSVKHSMVVIGHAAWGTTTSSQYAFINGGFWNSSTAINRIQLIPAAGSFIANSIATLYGWGNI